MLPIFGGSLDPQAPFAAERAVAGASPDPAATFAAGSEPEMLDAEEEKPILPRSVTPEESS